MAMGLKPSPDFAPSIIEDILSDLDVEIYIDYEGIFSNSYEDHMKLVSAILKRLEAKWVKSESIKM
jgi:hypothetical protein